MSSLRRSELYLVGLFAYDLASITLSGLEPFSSSYNVLRYVPLRPLTATTLEVATPTSAQRPIYYGLLKGLNGRRIYHD